MNTIKLNELVIPFIGTDTMRPAMMQLHNDNGTVVATNAHILLYAPESYFDGSISPVNEYPDWRKVIPEHEKPIGYVLISDYDQVHKKMPQEELKQLCHACDGEGYQECDLGHEHECERCGGAGRYGKVVGHYIDPNRYMMEINGHHFNADLLKNLIDIARFVGEDRLTIYHIDHFKCMLAKVKDIALIIMPMHTDEKAVAEYYQLEYTAING